MIRTGSEGTAPMLRHLPVALTALPHGSTRVVAPDASFFEFWPAWLFYLPVVAQWVALGLRHGDFSLPTAANPNITAGGLCGESKAMILDQLSGPERAAIAPYTAFALGNDVASDFVAAETARLEAELAYPLVIKPDVGCNGTGVRLLRDQAGLQTYLQDFTRPLAMPGLRLLLQEFVPYEGEAGIFYMRHPSEAHGRITSITLKSPPFVVGDGRSTLADLVRADPRNRRVAGMYLRRADLPLDDVLPSGERKQLTFVGNHCKGSLFQDGRAHATAALASAIEELARALPNFHFGRIDLRFRSLAELRQGQGFKVIEINGVGSEATHIWDPATSLVAAYVAQCQHYRAAFEIARANRTNGHRSTGLIALARLWRQQRRLLACYPQHD